MEHKHKVAILAVVGGIAIIDLLWRWKKHRDLGVATAPEPAEEIDPFMAPYMNTNPGINDATVNGGGAGGAFQGGDITVNVNPNIAQYLSNHYIPLFGFVGFGAH